MKGRMAVLCKALADGLLLIVILSLLGWRTEGLGNGRDMKEVSGGATLYLGQERDTWRPLTHTTVNLTEVDIIKSSFQIRTFDPEGAIFYGDTKDGEDWFILSLKDGIPLMQIKQGDMVVSVAGGPKLNDGKWHTLEVSNQGMFVILEVDGSDKVVVGMKAQAQEDMSGELRLALGGILMDKENMIVPLKPQLDGCVRDGSWLNLNIRWATDAEELWSCYQNIQPGSYFPGSGFAIFNTSVFPFDEDDGVKIDVEGDFSQMNGTVFSLKAPGQPLMVALVVNNNTQELTLSVGEQKIDLKRTSKRLAITFQAEMLQILQKEPKLSDLNVRVLRAPVLSTWKDGHLAIGSLLGEEGDNVGSQFLKGCLQTIKVQEKYLDLDLAVKQKSVSSHSCPA